ncbi:hypothetical protein BGZ90_011520 [Linnemannia elongata]|nr:hypothetical protein BGZ90_011520 [Linnemannia elongata]
MTDRPLDSPTNLSSRIEDTNGTRHVFVEIPLDVLMGDFSESVEEEKDLDGIVTDLTVTSPATAAMVDGDNDDDDDTDDESSTPSIYHEPQGLEEVSASSDNGSSNGTVYFPGEDDSNNDSMSTNATNFETQRLEWEIPANTLDGTYELVLGISSRNLDLKAVDSITFDYVYCDTITPESKRPSEVIPSSALKTLFATAVPRDDDSAIVQNEEEEEEEEEDEPTTVLEEGSSTAAIENDTNSTTDQEDEGASSAVKEGSMESYATTGDNEENNIDPVNCLTILRWSLHEKIALKSGAGGTIKVIMTIEVWKGVALDPGAIGLHFLELYQDSSKSYKDDPSYRRHNPFAWFIDINARTDSPPNAASKRIDSYCFSGNGAYVGLLIQSTLGQYLELHHVAQEDPSTSWKLPSSEETEFDISVSWDGSQAVVLYLKHRDLSAVYTRHKPKKRTWASSLMTSCSPGAQYAAGQSHSKIDKHYCRGTFHALAPADLSKKPPKDERFITFDGTTMSLYSTRGKWKLLDRRTLGKPEDSTGVDSKWKDHLRSGRMVLECGNGMYVSTQSLTGTNRLISAMDISTTEPDHPYVASSLSECGGLFVMATMDHLNVYLTDTWTRFGSWTLPNNVSLRQGVSDVHFTREGQRIVVSINSDLDKAIPAEGYVVDVGTMSTLGRIHSRGLLRHAHATINSTDRSTSVLLCQSETTLGAIRYTDRLIRPSSAMATKCNDQCASMESFQPQSSRDFTSEVVVRTVEPRDRRKMISMISVVSREADSIHNGAIEFPCYDRASILGIHRSHFEEHSILVVALSNLMLVWRIPKAHDGSYELLSAEGNDVGTEWAVCQHHQLHQRDTDGTISTRNLLDPYIHNSEAFLDGVVRLAETFKDADVMFKQSVIRYIERHINQRLDAENASAAILTRLCSTWTPESHEQLLTLIGALCGSPFFRWVPALDANRNASPIQILFDHLQKYLFVIDIVEVMINYCIRRAKADNDLHFLEPVFHSLRVARNFENVDDGLMARALRSFAYFPAREYHFAIDHHVIASKPYELNVSKMLHERKDPVLQLTDTSSGSWVNERLTPHLYVASIDMIWSVEEIPVPKRWYWKRIQDLFLFVTLTSRKRYVCHPFELEDLDNPALIALVRYKWMTFGFTYWFLKMSFYLYTTVFILFTAIRDIYVPSTGTYRHTIWTINIALSWIFALGSFRDLVVLFILKMKPRGSVYKAVEILSSLIPTIAFLSGSQLIEGLEDSIFYDFIVCFGILVVMTQFIFEFRVMRPVGGFISVLRRALRSIGVLLLVFAYLIFTFAVTFLYMQNSVCVDDACSNITATKPDNILMATTLTYFMTAGLYESVETNIKNRNWMVHLLLTLFIFSVTIMLNILFGMVNHAFDSDNRIATQEWMDNRMYLVTRAENMLRGLPFISKENSRRFPKRIYYTASSHQVRDYRAESQRLAKEAAFAALPLESDSHDDDSNATLSESPKSNPKHSGLDVEEDHQDRPQHASLDQLKEELRGEIKKELREELKAQKRLVEEQLMSQKRLSDKQLEAQQKQADERFEQVQTQLKDILAMMRAGVRK